MKKNLYVKMSGILSAFMIASALTVPVMAAQDFDPAIFGYIEPNKFNMDTFNIGLGTFKPNTPALNYKYDDYTFDYELPFGYVQGTQYRAVSSDNSVVTAVIEGVGVQLDGKRSGTATVSLQKMSNGKWVTTDTVAVKVDGTSYLHDYREGVTAYPIGDGNTGLEVMGRHPKGYYKYTVDKPGLTVYEVKDKEGNVRDIGYTATQYGDYTVTVTENVYGKIKEFKKKVISVKPTTINPTANYHLSDGSWVDTTKMVNNKREDRSYVFKMSDGSINNVMVVPADHSIVEAFVDNYGSSNKCALIQWGDGPLEFTQPGTCTVDVYEYDYHCETTNVDFNKPVQGMTYLGTCTITVTE